MKMKSIISKYSLLFVVFIVLILLFLVLDALLGKIATSNFWGFCKPGLAFITAVLILKNAEKHGWDTWSGLISKFKKNK